MSAGPAVDLTLGCNPVVNSANLYDGTVKYDHYGYNVHKGTAIVFTVLFGLSMRAFLPPERATSTLMTPTRAVLHLAFTFVFRAKRNMPGLVWWLIPTLVVGSLSESSLS